MELLRTSVSAALTKTDKCRQYIKDLIEEVAANTESDRNEIISTDIEKLLKIVYDSRGPSEGLGGVHLRLGTGGNARNHWNWKNGPGSADIYLGIEHYFPSGGWNGTGELLSKTVNEAIVELLGSPRYGGMITIHELMHVALKGRADDVDYARAAATLAGEVYTPIPYDETKESSASNRPLNYQASEYWGERLNQACGFPSHIRNKMTNYRLYR